MLLMHIVIKNQDSLYSLANSNTRTLWTDSVAKAFTLPQNTLLESLSSYPLFRNNLFQTYEIFSLEDCKAKYPEFFI